MADLMFDKILAQLGSAPAPTAKGKTLVLPATVDDMRSCLPEVVDGLLDENGQNRPGTLISRDDGRYGNKGAIYIVRNVEITPERAQYILSKFGQGNRDPIAARQKAVTEKMKNGEWCYVGNTVVLTVSKAGVLTLNEQHNGGHSFRGIVEALMKCGLFTFIMGIPVSERDKIDDNAARTAKDIATTRSEIKEFFQVGRTIGGAVQLTKQMADKCTATLTESLRIVDDVRKGLQPKSGGVRDKGDVGDKLDLYGPSLCKSISLAVAMDSRCPTVDAKTGKVKTSGALTKRIPLNHASALLCLAASVKNADNTIGWSDEKANLVLAAFMDVANETNTDATSPMVSFRQTIDEWNASKKHDGSTGKNTRFAALKMAYLKAIENEEIRNPNWLNEIASDLAQRVNKPALQVGGIDDFKDDTEEKMKAASAPKESNDPLPLIPEEEIQDVGSDVPTDLIPE